MFWQRILISILRFILSVYYENIHRTGDAVPDGPVIVIANHPNMLLDPVLTSVYSGRGDFAFWAKSTLFRGLAGKILRALGAVPVYRKKDFPEGAVIDNAAMFESSIDALVEGRGLVLFPEGISYTESKMQSLKTGMARVAQAYLERTGKQVPIVPVGLNYIAKHKFRSQVQISYGEPLYLDESIQDEREQVRECTGRAEAALFSLTVNADDWPTLLDLRVAREIYVDGRPLTLEAHVGIEKRLALFYSEHKDEEGIPEIRADVRQYREQLERFGLHDWQINPKLTKQNTLPSLLIGKGMKSIIMLPFAVVSFLLHLPAYLLGRLINRSNKDLEERATNKFLLLFAFVPLWYLIVLSVLFFLLSPVIFLTCLIVLPLFGIIQVTIIQAERHSFSSLKDLLWLVLLLKNSKKLLDELTTQRERIREAIDEVAKAYLAQTGKTSFLRKSMELETRDLTQSRDFIPSK